MAMHNRRQRPGSTNPFTGRGLPNSSPYRDHGHGHGNGSGSGPMASAMAKKALLIVVAFTAFFYMVSSGVDDKYVPPKSNLQQNDYMSKENQIKPKKLVIPPDNSASGGGNGNEESNSNDGRDLERNFRDREIGHDETDGSNSIDQMRRGESADGDESDRFGAEDSNDNRGSDSDNRYNPFGKDSNANPSNDGSNDRSNDNDNDMDFRENNDKGFDADRMFGQFDDSQNNQKDSQDVDLGGDSGDWGGDNEAPPSRDEPPNGASNDGLFAGNDSEDQHLGSGLRGSRSGNGNGGNLSNGFGREEPKDYGDSNDLGGRSKSAGFMDTPVSENSYDGENKLGNDSVDEKSYGKSGLTMEKALDFEQKHHYTNKNSDANSMDNETKNSGDASDNTYYKHQDQMAIPRAVERMSESNRSGRFDSEDGLGEAKGSSDLDMTPDPKDSAYQKTHLDDGDSKKYLEKYLNSDKTKGSDDLTYKKEYSHTNTKGHSTHEKNMDVSGATKDSGDGNVREYPQSNEAQKNYSDMEENSSSDKYRESAQKSDEMYLKLKESTYHKPIDNVEANASGDASSYHKKSDSAAGSAKDSGDANDREYLQHLSDHKLVDSDKTKLSDDVSYKKKYYDAKKHFIQEEIVQEADKVASYKESGDETKDSSDVKAKEYLKSNKHSGDHNSVYKSDKVSGDAVYNEKYSHTRDHSHYKESSHGDSLGEGSHSGTREHTSHKTNLDEVGASIKMSDAIKDPSDAKNYVGSNDNGSANQRRFDSDDLDERKTYSDTKQNSSYSKNIDEVGVDEKTSDAIYNDMKYKHEGLRKEDEKPTADMEASADSEKSNEVKQYAGNDDKGPSDAKHADSGDSYNKEGVSADNEGLSNQKHITELVASGDATKDSSDVKKYVDSGDKGSSDQKLVDSGDSYEKEGDSTDDKESSNQKSVAEMEASVDAPEDSSDVNESAGSNNNGSSDQKLADSGDTNNVKEGDSADHKDSSDHIAESKASEDAAKDSSAIKEDAGSDDKGSSELNRADNGGTNMKESESVDDKNAKVEAPAEAAKESSDMKGADSDNASGDQKAVDAGSKPENPGDVADKKSQSDDLADESSGPGSDKDSPNKEIADEAKTPVQAIEVVKNSSEVEKKHKSIKDSTDEQISKNDEKVIEIEASKDSGDLKEENDHTGSEKASSDQKSVEEGAASDDKKNEGTKNSSDNAEKKSEQASTDQKDINETGDKDTGEEGGSKEKSGLLSMLRKNKKNKESDADAVIAPTEEKKDEGEPEKESDTKKAGLLSKLHLRRKKTDDNDASTAASHRRLQLATWNIAAINNNPFEYWISYDENPAYEKIMSAIEEFIDDPGKNDVPVSTVFTDDMFSQLEKRMGKAGWDSVRSYWDDDFKNRKIVTEFMKDPLLGSKRLASMPDRITNTINVEGSDEPVFRPTVINQYAGDLSDNAKWWSEWEKFMFDTKLKIQMKDKVVKVKPYEMLQPIKKSKYPDITEEEEKVSLPLQTMCGAIFDAILVHMMNTVSTPDEWQPLKKTMVENLNKQKIPHTLEILENVYGDFDVITLQEVSASLIGQAKKRALGDKFWIIAPEEMDAVRDQNSVILLNRETFPDGSKMEITSLVEKSFEEGVAVPIAKGDILAITTKDRDDTPFIIASFHGDTNGLATKPVLSAITKAMSSNSALSSAKLLFGLDANTYAKAKPGKQQDVKEFGEHYVSHGLTSCWGDVPSRSNYTTFNSRTYLQPQLNKACKKEDKRANGDVNPKDFILFGKGDFKVAQTWKDNTGEKKYIEDMAFPTLKFPSDHGILATILEPSGTDAAPEEDSKSAKSKIGQDEGKNSIESDK